MDPIDNFSAVLYGVEDLRLEHKPIPELENNQVVIRMESVGICASDLSMYSKGQFGLWSITQPVTIGHEGTGIVMRTGKDVKNLQLGDRVVIEPIRGCKICKNCKIGFYHLCPNILRCSIPPTDGMMSRFYVYDEDFCHKLPDNIDLEEGVFICQLAVVIHACKRAKMTFGHLVLVFGAGTIGILTAVVAKLSGARKTLVIDIYEYRLDMAKKLGVNFTLQIQKDTPHEDIVNKIKEILGREPDISIDCVGRQDYLNMALQVTKSGGVVIPIGLPSQEETEVVLSGILAGEIDLRGVFGFHNDFPTAIEMIKSKKINVKPLISHHFKIEDANVAFKTGMSSKDEAFKIIVHPDENWKHIECLPCT